jgi:hypothetical protein
VHFYASSHFNEFISKFDGFNDLVTAFLPQFNALLTSRIAQEFPSQTKIHTAKPRGVQAVQAVLAWVVQGQLAREAETSAASLQRPENSF